jgi:large subunit ribosomal protein L25
MPDTTLVAQTGRRTGSPSSRRLRADDTIPGVLYGQGMAPVTLSVARRDLRLALSGAAGSNTLLKLSVDGTTYPAIVKEMQRHPIRRTVSHVDFLQVNMREEITISVPVHLQGEAKAVLNEGGLVDPAVDTIDVTCTPGNMPNEFVIDISDMQPGDVIRLGDIPMPANVTAEGDPDMPVVTTIMARLAVEEEGAEGEGEEGAEGAEASEGGDNTE